MIDEELSNNPNLKKKNTENGMPELYSMQFKKKIFNNRLSNDPENLGNLVTGITKDINELSQLILYMEKYGNTAH